MAASKVADVLVKCLPTTLVRMKKISVLLTDARWMDIEVPDQWTEFSSMKQSNHLNSTVGRWNWVIWCLPKDQSYYSDIYVTNRTPTVCEHYDI
jgi:hypothetical protein